MTMTTVEFDPELIDNPALSFKARGVLLHLLTLPADTEVNSSVIAAAGTEGRDSIRNALRELEDLGYVRRWRKSWMWNGNPTRWTTHA